ncbi:MAG: hypothetical protein HC815_17130 [Richelia sp. RM1_1_1]|nr:hypothetical protein [Richelia sp. RM1_1_1]
MILQKSVDNFRCTWIASLLLSGCFALFFIFQKNAEAVELKAPFSIAARNSTVTANTIIAQRNTSLNPTNLQWIPFVFAGGLVGYGGFLVKQLVDAKDTTIKNLQDAKNDLENGKNQEIKNLKDEYESRLSNLKQDNQRLEKKLQSNIDFKDLFDTLISELEKQGLTRETDSSLRKIINALNELKNYEEEVEPLHRTAGSWIEDRKNIWLGEMVEYAAKKYPEELKDKKAEFTKDISECLEWLHDSTFYNRSHEFLDYLPKRSIDSIFPYRACFDYLRQKNDTGDLNYAENNFLNKFLDELIQYFN